MNDHHHHPNVEHLVVSSPRVEVPTRPAREEETFPCPVKVLALPAEHDKFEISEHFFLIRRLPPPDRGGEKCPKNWAVCVLDDKKGRSTLTLIIILVNMQPIPQDQLMTVAHSCALLKTQESFSSFLKTLQHSSEGVGEPGTFYRGFARRSHAVRCWKPPSTELRPIFKDQGLIDQNNLCLKKSEETSPRRKSLAKQLNVLIPENKDRTGEKVKRSSVVSGQCGETC